MIRRFLTLHWSLRIELIHSLTQDRSLNVIHVCAVIEKKNLTDYLESGERQGKQYADRKGINNTHTLPLKIVTHLR